MDSRRWAWLGLALTAAAASLLVLAADRAQPPAADVVAAEASPVPEPAPAEVVLVRSELTITERGERILRASDGPGIQGWLTAEGGERPRWLTARGEGLEIGQRVAIAEDGRFAIADAVGGKRYLLMLPEGFVTSDAPSSESVVGSRYVHLIAPARLDVYAQTLASTLRLRLELPDGAGPAAWMTARCTLDGRDARVFTGETDAQGWLIVPLPSDGWWTNLAVDPRLHDDVLYDPVHVSRVDVPSSGVIGALPLRRSRVVPVLFLDPDDLPVAGVRAQDPVSCAPSDADGRLRVREREVEAARWTHQDCESSVASWPESRHQLERIVRMVPRGSWRLVAVHSNTSGDLALRQVTGAFGPGRMAPRRGTTLRKLHEDGFVGWELENRRIGPGDGLLVEWRGIPIRIEPLGFAHGTGEVWPIAAPELTAYLVEVLRPDGSPAAGATVSCSKEPLGRADASGLLGFELPAVLDPQRLTFDGGTGMAPISFAFDARSRPAVPRVLQFESAMTLQIEISVAGGELPRTIEVATEGEQGTMTATLRQRGGVAIGGKFPAGLRWYRVSAQGFESRSLRHDAASSEPLRVTLEAKPD